MSIKISICIYKDTLYIVFCNGSELNDKIIGTKNFGSEKELQKNCKANFLWQRDAYRLNKPAKWPVC